MLVFEGTRMIERIKELEAKEQAEKHALMDHAKRIFADVVQANEQQAEEKKKLRELGREEDARIIVYLK